MMAQSCTAALGLAELPASTPPTHQPTHLDVLAIHTDAAEELKRAHPDTESE